MGEVASSLAKGGVGEVEGLIPRPEPFDGTGVFVHNAFRGNSEQRPEGGYSNGRVQPSQLASLRETEPADVRKNLSGLFIAGRMSL